VDSGRKSVYAQKTLAEGNLEEALTLMKMISDIEDPINIQSENLIQVYQQGNCSEVCFFEIGTYEKTKITYEDSREISMDRLRSRLGCRKTFEYRVLGMHSRRY
jgi:hypothetical protein